MARRMKERQFIKRWLWGFLFGIAFEISIFIGLHQLKLYPLMAIQNWAFDGVMRLTAARDWEPVPDARGLAFVDIDDATWRNSLWGGAEPYRAPRSELLALIDRTFQHGARQVVLDVLVEEREYRGVGTGLLVAERDEDLAFIRGLERLLSAKHFGADRQLVLVRSARRDVQSGVSIDAIRPSPSLDKVVARSEGRIVYAAPHFTRDADHVLRGWQLYKEVCEPAGSIRVLPSVQIAVYAKNEGMTAEWRKELPLCADRRYAPGQSEQDIGMAYWTYFRSQLCRTPSARCPLPKQLTEAFENRVVFRFPYPASDFRVQVVPALELLHDSAGARSGATRLHDQLDGRIVVMAQTFDEAGDRHLTPLGEMPGGWVLVNAIDSMTQHRFVHEPRRTIVFAIAVVISAIVALIFARWHSLLAAVVLAAVLILLFLPLSYFAFTYALWLDFAFPVLGVVVHRFLHGAGDDRHSAH